MFHNAPHQSAKMLFRAQPAEPGSDAEKLVNFRKGMQQRKRELRDVERRVREAARAIRHSSAALRTIT